MSLCTPSKMARPGSNSDSRLQVKVPAVEDHLANSPTHRETRSPPRKRNVDQVAESEEIEDVNRGSLDSSHPQTPMDAVENHLAQNLKRQKKVRTSATAKSQVPQKKDLPEQLKDLEEQKKRLEKKVKTLEASLKSVTRESVLNARRGTKGVWDQAKIETELKNLKKDIKDWVKRYGTTKKISSFPDAHKKDILLACTTDHYQKVFSKDDFDAIQELPRGAHLLLEGFLYARAVYVLVSRPFVFIDAVLQEHSHPNNTILAYGNIESLFAEFAESLAECKDFPDQCQRWTASMLQSLKRMIIPEPLDDIAFHQRDEKMIDSYRIYELGISQLAKGFVSLEKPSRHLLNDRLHKKQSDQRREDLKFIYRKFRELAYHMWCQPSTVSCSYGPDMFESDLMDLNTTAIQAHEETEAERLKGNKVLIHTNPMITGEIIEPDDSKSSAVKKTKVVYLRQKVWTIDCQTRGQWNAIKKESLSEVSESNSQTAIESDVQNGSPELVTENTSVDVQSVSGTHDQESTDTNDTTSSPQDAGSDPVSEVQSLIKSSSSDTEMAQFTESQGRNDATEHDDLDVMAQD